MSKIDLLSREWCDLIFEGRNKEYGAYRLRARMGRRQLAAVLIVLGVIVSVVILLFISSVVKEQMKSTEVAFDEAMEMQKIKQEKKEEKKKEIEIKYEKPEVQKVAVKASIQFTVPKIVDDDKVVKEQQLKNMDELITSKAAIGSQTYKGDVGGTVNIDDLKDNQQAGGTEAPEEDKDKVYAVVEQPPTFPGGEAALLAYVAKNIKYPASALEQEIQGVVLLRFVVLENGSVGEVLVTRGIDPACDKEAVRVVKSLPRFIPGKQQGKGVKVWYTLPIRFQIQ